MAKIRRIIRKTKSPAESPFDEQMWPLILALFVLGGFMAGTVLAYLSFEDKRWYANAATWLFAIPIMACLAIWLLRRLSTRSFRRSLQLSAVLCLIIHVILFVISIETDIFGRFWEEIADNPNLDQPRELILEPEPNPVQLQAENQRERDLLRPVTSTTPDPEVREIPQQRQDEQEATPERQPVPTPEAEPAIVPHVIPRKPTAETSPRQSDHTSRLSRQVAEAKPRPDEHVARPQVAPPSSAQPSQLETQQALARRAAAQLEMERPTASPEATAATPQPDVRLSRRSPQATPQPEASPAARFQRRLAQPARIPRSDIAAADTPAAPRETRPETLTPNNTAARRQQTASPSRDRVVSQPVPEPLRDVSEQAKRRDQRNPQQPSLAQTPTPVPNPRARLTPRPDIATMASETGDRPSKQQTPTAQISPSRMTAGRRNVANTAPSRTSAEPSVVSSPANRVASAIPRKADSADAPQISTTTGPRVAASRKPQAASPTTSNTAAAASRSGSDAPNTQAVGPAAATVARRGGSGPAGTRGGPQPTSPSATAAANPGAMASRRTAVAAVPTIAPDTPTGGAPSRATRSAEIAGSPTQVESPAIAAAEQGDGQRVASPARMALSRSLAGRAGIGQSPNMNRALPADTSPAMIASGSARRREATQQAPDGPALAPSALARVHRSIAGDLMPSATVEATTAESAPMAGVQETGELNASSSASLTRQMAAAEEGAVTAASGRVEVDMGPTRVVDEQGHARASGGGQPELNFETDSPNLARSRPGGGTPMSLNAAAAPAVEAPPGTGGGQPMTEFDPAATRLSRAGQGQAQPTAGGPETDATGPAAGAPTSDLVEGAMMARGDQQSATSQGNSGPQIPDASDGTPLARQTARAAPSTSTGVTAIDPQAPAGNAAQPQVAMGGAGEPNLPRAQQPGADIIGSLAANLHVPDGQQGGEMLGEAIILRAEAVEAAQGLPLPGGGTASPQRAPRSREIASNLTAENVSVAGSPDSGGMADGLPTNNSGLEPRRSPSGALGSPAVTTTGALAGNVAVEGTGSGPPDFTPTSKGHRASR